MSISIINRKAKFEYEFIRTEVAGIVLMGSEIKSIRKSRVNLSDSFCSFIDGELYLRNANIAENGTDFCHEAIRDRKLLLKKRELNKLKKELIKEFTIVPYKLFINERGFCKIEIALAKGKKTYDKREAIKARETKIEIQRNLK